MNLPAKPKLVDVARAAEVSVATASNVFAHPERVRPAVRERVEAAARALGYLGPDPTARLMRAGKVNAIGVIPPGNWGVHDTLRNPVFYQFLLGVAQACDEAGVNLLVSCDLHRPGAASAVVDGFIFTRVEHMGDVEAARLRRLPFVVMDSDPGGGGALGAASTPAPAPRWPRGTCSSSATGASPSCPSCATSGRRGSIRRGGRGRPTPPGWRWTGEKLLGYADALAEAGIAIDEVPMVQAHPWERDAARLILDVAPEATAILSMSAMQAVAVMDEARLRGKAVPRDLSVVGYNDIPEAARSTPPLTTVDGMNAEKGRVAGRLLLEGRAGAAGGADDAASGQGVDGGAARGLSSSRTRLRQRSVIQGMKAWTLGSCRRRWG